MEADKKVVNCIECHPHTTVLASSGIESDIKLWTPKALERASVPTNIEEVCFLLLANYSQLKRLMLSYYIWL